MTAAHRVTSSCERERLPHITAPRVSPGAQTHLSRCEACEWIERRPLLTGTEHCQVEKIDDTRQLGGNTRTARARHITGKRAPVRPKVTMVNNAMEELTHQVRFFSVLYACVCTTCAPSSSLTRGRHRFRRRCTSSPRMRRSQ